MEDWPHLIWCPEVTPELRVESSGESSWLSGSFIHISLIKWSGRALRGSSRYSPSGDPSVNVWVDGRVSGGTIARATSENPSTPPDQSDVDEGARSP